MLQLVLGEGIALAPALCEAVQALLARLQEQVAAACTEDPLGGMPLPARCHDLLQMLLEAAWQVRQGDRDAKHSQPVQCGGRAAWERRDVQAALLAERTRLADTRGS